MKWVDKSIVDMALYYADIGLKVSFLLLERKIILVR